MKKVFFSSYRECGRRASAAWSIFSLILLISACAPKYAPSVTAAASQYKPVRIAAGVPSQPGSLAWSPDGTRLAFIGKTLMIYDTVSGERRAVLIENPYYVAWAADGTLYSLSHDAKMNSVLCSIDTMSFLIKSFPLDLEANALYPSSDGKTLIILTRHIKRFSFGTEISYRLLLRAVTEERTKTVYTFSKLYSIKNPDIALLTAWTHAGLNPLDNALLVMEHVTPPVVSPYTRVKEIDFASGQVAELSDRKSKKTYLSACWSPDGSRAVMTDGGGRLEIWSRQGKKGTIDPSPLGVYPSWNPKGSRIYSGGYLIDADGKNSEALITNGARSISQWSPDGTMLVVAAGEELLLFRNVTTSYVLPDRPLDKVLSEKLSQLKDLLADGVVSSKEYQERRNKLIQKSEDGQ